MGAELPHQRVGQDHELRDEDLTGCFAVDQSHGDLFVAIHEEIDLRIGKAIAPLSNLDWRRRWAISNP